MIFPSIFPNFHGERTRYFHLIAISPVVPSFSSRAPYQLPAGLQLSSNTLLSPTNLEERGGQFLHKEPCKGLSKMGLPWLVLSRTTFMNPGRSTLLTAPLHSEPPRKILKLCFYQLLLSHRSPPCTCMCESLPLTIHLHRFC